MDAIIDVSSGWIVTPYFTALMIFGGLFLTNYLLAECCVVFTSHIENLKLMKEDLAMITAKRGSEAGNSAAVDGEMPVPNVGRPDQGGSARASAVSAAVAALGSHTSSNTTPPSGDTMPRRLEPLPLEVQQQHDLDLEQAGGGGDSVNDHHQNVRGPAAVTPRVPMDLEASPLLSPTAGGNHRRMHGGRNDGTAAAAATSAAANAGTSGKIRPLDIQPLESPSDRFTTRFLEAQRHEEDVTGQQQTIGVGGSGWGGTAAVAPLHLERPEGACASCAKKIRNSFTDFIIQKQVLSPTVCCHGAVRTSRV